MITQPRSRVTGIALVVSLGLVVTGGAISRIAGLRLNDSVSMPRGLYRVEPLDGPLQRGEVVTVCPPMGMAMLDAIQRDYVPHGDCEGGFAPLVKPVGAVPGDEVTLTPGGIDVNGEAIPNTAQLVADSAGRPLHAMPPMTYKVAAGQVWLIANFSEKSFDSRYFGPVPIAAVMSRARPVWTAP